MTTCIASPLLSGADAARAAAAARARGGPRARARRASWRRSAASRRRRRRASPRPTATSPAGSVKGRLGQLRGEQDALQLLLAIERVVVGAYFVALTKLEDRRLIVLVAQIMANDAQHEALLGELLYPGRPRNAVPYGLVQGVQ